MNYDDRHSIEDELRSFQLKPPTFDVAEAMFEAGQQAARSAAASTLRRQGRQVRVWQSAAVLFCAATLGVGSLVLFGPRGTPTMSSDTPTFVSVPGDANPSDIDDLMTNVSPFADAGDVSPGPRFDRMIVTADGRVGTPRRSRSSSTRTSRTYLDAVRPNLSHLILGVPSR